MQFRSQLVATDIIGHRPLRAARQCGWRALNRRIGMGATCVILSARNASALIVCGPIVSAQNRIDQEVKPSGRWAARICKFGLEGTVSKRAHLPYEHAASEE